MRVARVGSEWHELESTIIDSIFSIPNGTLTITTHAAVMHVSAWSLGERLLFYTVALQMLLCNTHWIFHVGMDGIYSLDLHAYIFTKVSIVKTPVQFNS